MTAAVLYLVPRPDTGMLSSAEAADLAGISYRQIDHWCRHGVITPVGANHPSVGDTATPGTGRHRRFSVDQVPLLRACGELSLLGADTTIMSALVEACDDIELPATVAIDIHARAHVVTARTDLGRLGACTIVTVTADL